MSGDSRFEKTRLASLLAIVGVTGGLILAVYLLFAAKGTPVPVRATGSLPMHQEEPSTALSSTQEEPSNVLSSTQEEPSNVLSSTQEEPSNALSSTQLATTTAYLPIVAREFRMVAPLFGVEFGQPINDVNGLAQAVQANIRWGRFSAFDWSKIEPTHTNPATYDWSVVDEQSLINASANNITVIATIRFAPSWALPPSGSACGAIQQSSLDEYAQFLTALVQRYRAAPYNVRYWELGNEPDVDPSIVPPDSVFGCWGDINDPYYGGGYYAAMLKAAYPAIKAADPMAQVLIGGLLLDCNPDNPPAGKDCTPSKFLEGILLNGGGPYFDVVSFHAYAYFFEPTGEVANPNWPGAVTAVPEKVSFLRSVLSRYGYPEKPLMNTENALLCWDPTSACREKQARYVARAYAEASALGLDAQVYFALRNDSWHYTGLLDQNLTPRPAYNAYKASSSFLTSAVPLGAATGYPAGIQGYSYRQAGTLQHVDVIWSADGTPLSVTLPAGASAYDHYGTLLATSGAVQVDDGPVYIKRP
jgi:hypothetical protein